MSKDLVLRPSCSGCGSSSDLYGSNCKHMTLCFSCGKSMAQKKAKRSDCGATLTRLIREYNVRANTDDDKNYFIGRFSTGLPKFSRNKKNEWSLCKNKSKDGLPDNLQNEPWVLEDEAGQSQYQGHLELQSAAYYLLMQQGNEISAVPAGSWFNFDKVPQYNKQLTLEEAEEKMICRKKMQDGYQRWLMRAATKGDEDEEEEGARRNRLRLERRGGDDEGASGDDDLDNDDSEKGNDWDVEEMFSDDDENNPEETEDFAPEIPAPPELKQFLEDDEEDDNNEEEGGLSKYGKELKKLLRHLNESETQDDDEDTADDIGNSPLPVACGSAQTTPSKGKRKRNDDDDAKASSGAPLKKLKTENNQDQKPCVKEDSGSASFVTEEEIRAVLGQQAPMNMQDLLNNFPGRLRSNEEKAAFLTTLSRMPFNSLLLRKRKTMEPFFMLY